MRKAPTAHSVPSDSNEVTLLELLGVLSCLSELGGTRVLHLAEQKHYPSLWGPNPAAIGIFPIPVTC